MQIPQVFALPPSNAAGYLRAFW